MMGLAVFMKNEDIWCLSQESAGLFLSLQMKTHPLADVAEAEIAWDDAGTPYLVLLRENKVEYFHWGGTDWQKSELPPLSGALDIKIVWHQGVMHLLSQFPEGIRHWFCRNGQWLFQSTLQGECLEIKALFSVASAVLLLTETCKNGGACLQVLSWQNGSWHQSSEMNLAKGEFLEGLLWQDRIYILIAAQDFSESAIRLYEYDPEKQEIYERFLLEIRSGWEGKPGLFFERLGAPWFFWQSRGVLQLTKALPNGEAPYVYVADFLSPAHIVSLRGGPDSAGWIAFDMIGGRTLGFPLVMSGEDLIHLLKKR